MPGAVLVLAKSIQSTALLSVVDNQVLSRVMRRVKKIVVKAARTWWGRCLAWGRGEMKGDREKAL